jgi:mono/diheme cytochrome c family protein
MTIVRYLPLAVVALAIANFNIAGDVLAAEVPEYTVKDGKVDKGTYNGYRRFHGTCHACHGQDAMGSSFAPALVESLKTVDYDTFVKTVTEGRQVTDATGAVRVMPAFGHDPNISKHLDDIYRYLTARADGAIPPGRPKKIPK